MNEHKLDCGLCVIKLLLTKARNIKVGAMGTVKFDAGRYHYIGSAKKNPASY